ncbi:hypothetical protein KI387_019220, partial [Taxus chinensis]
NGLCCLFSWLGMADHHGSTWQEYPEISYDVSSARLSDIIRKNLPVSTFRKFAQRSGQTEDDITCAVCLSSFGEEDRIRELCNCCHIFHSDCLDKWIDHSQQTCPLCRCPLLPQTKGFDGREEEECSDELLGADRGRWGTNKDLGDHGESVSGGFTYLKGLALLWIDVTIITRVAEVIQAHTQKITEQGNVGRLPVSPCKEIHETIMIHLEGVAPESLKRPILRIL